MISNTVVNIRTYISSEQAVRQNAIEKGKIVQSQNGKKDHSSNVLSIKDQTYSLYVKWCCLSSTKSSRLNLKTRNTRLRYRHGDTWKLENVLAYMRLKKLVNPDPILTGLWLLYSTWMVFVRWIIPDSQFPVRGSSTLVDLANILLLRFMLIYTRLLPGAARHLSYLTC